MLNSDDGGRSWRWQLVVREGPSACSNLLTRPNGNLACLFESEVKRPYERVAFKQLTIQRLEPTSGAMIPS